MSWPRHIFLITIDCLRADFTKCASSATSSGARFTPHIDALSEDSVVFTRAFANGPGTNQSFPAILTSTYFLMHAGLRLLPRFPTLAEVLSNGGFKTVAFHSNPFLSESLGWGRGFDEFHDFMESTRSPSAFITRQRDASVISRLARFASTALQGDRTNTIQRLLKSMYYKFTNLQIPYLEGEKLNSQVIRWIERNRAKRFFVWMHYMDPHYPYVPPEPYLSTFSSRHEAFDFNLSTDYHSPSRSEVKAFKSLYCGEVMYVDQCVGDFVQYLEDNGLLDSSVILLMADHGHAFMEHGKFGHAYDILYNEVLHVPLLLCGLEASKRIEVPVQLLDIPPTILDIVGLKKPPGFMGRSLIPSTRGDKRATPLISESARPCFPSLKYDLSEKAVSCIVGKWKLIINEMLNSTELYNIERDFEEKVNMATAEKERVEEFEVLVQKHFVAEKLSKKRSLRQLPTLEKAS